jgi:hypothetical protein
MPGPTFQSQAPLKRRPAAGLTRVHQLLSHAPAARTPLRSSAMYATLSLSPIAVTLRRNPPSLLFLFALPSLCSSSRTESHHRRERHCHDSSTGAATLVRHTESSLACLCLKHGHRTKEHPRRSTHRRCCREVPPCRPTPPATEPPYQPFHEHHADEDHQPWFGLGNSW